MHKSRGYLPVLSTLIVLLFIAFVCDAQTIRSRMKFEQVEGITGVITNIGGTRVTISSQETDESFTVHVRDAGDLKVGDTVRMEGGRPVKVETPVKTDAPPEPPKQVEIQKTGEAQPATPAPEPQSEPQEPPKPGPNAQK